MTRNLGTWMMGYGGLLIVIGVIGYLSNPEKAATALLSGGTFGALSILWGGLLRRGTDWARWGALATTGLLTVVFTWRATVGWLAVQGGQPEKLVAAVLITVMGVASLATIVVLLAPAAKVGRDRADGPRAAAATKS